MKDNSMMLNNFDYNAVEAVFNQLRFGIGTHDLINVGCPKDFKKGTSLILMYTPLVRRIDVKEYNGGEFYRNPIVEIRLVTASIFLRSIGITPEFEKLFSDADSNGRR